MRFGYGSVGVASVAGSFACASLIFCARLSPTVAVEAAIESENGGASSSRTRSGLLALYDFRSSNGPFVKDRSGVGTPVDLRITNAKSVRRSNGTLEVRGTTLIRSDKPALKIIDAIRRTGEITIEAWVRPAKTNLVGPARIVTLSKDANERNFTVGQEGNRFDFRFRTNRTCKNGMPSLSSPANSLATRLTHLVYSRDRSGRTRVYLNGQQRVERMVAGTSSNWSGSFRFALANELSGDRPWQGTYYLVAIYSRNLAPAEVTRHFKAGAHAASGSLAAGPDAKAIARRAFETNVAPLLARHCLECHDTASKKGGLDISRKAAALAGGESGRAFVPGKAAASLLWESVESNKMPKQRPSLSVEDKKLLKQWIDAGAVWSLDVIDPVIYAHKGRAADIWVQRLTLPEYIETVRAAVGVDIADDARKILPPDLRADGFSNTAYNLNVDLKRVDANFKLAQLIVGRMDVKKFARRFSKSQRLTDDSMRDLIAKLGKSLLRGPLAEHEIVTYRGISTTVASTGGNFEEAVSFIIEAMLQSPRFIYRIENQLGDGTAWPVGGYELASRLSYIMWGGPPDEELMRAADADELSDRARVAEQVQRMLRDPRVVDRSEQFLYEWLDLARLENLRPDRKRFSNWDVHLAADMRDETLAFFHDVVWKQKRPLADLLNAQSTVATLRLAKHYGLRQGEAPAEPSARRLGGSLALPTLLRYDLSKVAARGGLLTQGSVLTIGGGEASMVSRGLFVLHELLRGAVKDPPPCVDTTPVPTKAGLTQRGIAEGRIANINCGGCHAKFEPLAFGLEKFDGLGTYRDQDKHGNKLRDDGEVFFPGTAKPVKYQSSAELMNLLARSERVRQSMTWKVTQFAMGRPLLAADAPIVDRIHKLSQNEGGTYTSLITAIVMSDLVQMTRTESNR